MDRDRRELLVLGLVLAALAAGGYGWWRRANPEPPRCGMCDRPIHPPTAFSATIEGRRTWTCCPRCGLSQCAGKAAGDLGATDFVTGKAVPADRCVYVVGSDLTPCCSPEVLVGRDKVPCGRCFDRCSPSVIAFADPGEAAAFAKDHGGRTIGFGALVTELGRP